MLVSLLLAISMFIMRTDSIFEGVKGITGSIMVFTKVKGKS